MQTFAAIGNCAVDVTPEGNFAGGSALYASVAASRLGLRAVAFTNFGSDFRKLNPAFDDVEVVCQGATNTTTFGISYRKDVRRLVMLNPGSRIDGLDGKVKADIIYFCPIAGEYGSELVSAVGLSNPDALAVATPQGWMRSWASRGAPVAHKDWSSARSILPGIDVLVLSVEDIGGNPGILDSYIALTGTKRNGGVVILTEGSHGATAYWGGKKLFKSSFEARAVDPTGAGDVFASAFAIRYHESKSVPDSLAFAHSAAAFATEGIGTSSIAGRAAVESRLAGRF
ncbi:hypothetical protein HYU18_04060 [Candidatus Woesearchaeota archaeon]|nr:hypothetical protein [Candidatus Woesearchaeota archaeon]